MLISKRLDIRTNWKKVAPIGQNIKITVLIFLLLPAFCFAQNKGDNTVIIKDSTISLDRIRTEWMKAGFAIDKDSKDYLTTEVLQQKGWYGVKYSAFKDADSIILKGWVKVDISLNGVRYNELVVADFKGVKGSANKEAFTELLAFAKKLSAGAYTLKQ